MIIADKHDACPICRKPLKGPAYEAQSCGGHFAFGHEVSGPSLELHRSADALGQAARSFGQLSACAVLLALLAAGLLGIAVRAPAPDAWTGPCRVGLCTDGRAEKNAPPKLYTERLLG